MLCSVDSFKIYNKIEQKSISCMSGGFQIYEKMIERVKNPILISQTQKKPHQKMTGLRLKYELLILSQCNVQ